MGLYKLESFCTAKETTKQIKKSLQNGSESLPAVHLTVMDKYPECFKEFKTKNQANNKTSNNSFKKWAWKLNRKFSEEKEIIVKKYLKMFIITSN